MLLSVRTWPVIFQCFVLTFKNKIQKQAKQNKTQTYRYKEQSGGCQGQRTVMKTEMKNLKAMVSNFFICQNFQDFTYF